MWKDGQSGKHAFLHSHSRTDVFLFLQSHPSEDLCDNRPNRKKNMTSTNLSEATMNTWRFTAKYFPFPQPTSNPTEPGSRFCKKRSIIGQGFSKGEKKKEISLNGLGFVLYEDYF
jgi:hypothetical protein